MKSKRVSLYDTTLRDGTQGTGISFSVLDKLRVAERLDAFGVDFIEGGWPGSNPKDATFFEEAAKLTWNHARISAFGMTRRGGGKADSDPQLEALLKAETPVVTIVGKTWKVHVTDVFGVSLEENLAMIADTIQFLKGEGRDVFYDAEHFFDAFRDDPDYALATLHAAAGAGAECVVLCDTNGGSLPGAVSAATHQAVAALGGLPVGIHTHNDAGLGVANALAAIEAGATQVQGTMNGYGERVGNCNLTTLIPNLELKMGIRTIPDLSALRELSLFVDELANIPPNVRAPYVGAAAFTHKGGLHVHAVQKFSQAYEHIEPAQVGNAQSIAISDMSGQSNILVKAKTLGFDLRKGSPEVAAILREIKEAEARGFEYEAAEGSFDLLIRKCLGHYTPLFELKEYHCHFRRTRGGPEPCEATVKLLVNGVPEYTVEEGDGPVNALDAALRKALRPFYPWIDEVSLRDYKVRIVDGSRGTAARTRVLVVSSAGDLHWGTVGASGNIIQASWLALVDSLEFYRHHREETKAPSRK